MSQIEVSNGSGVKPDQAIILRPGHLPHQARGVLAIVTPEWARWVIENYNSDNRPHSRVAEIQYARAMVGGCWRLTHQGICFSDSDPPRLLDGQTRLMASARSGASFEVYLWTDMSEETMRVIDNHRKRNQTDSLRFSGLDVTRNQITISNVFMIAPDCTTPARLTNDEMAAVLDACGDAIRFAIEHASYGTHKTFVVRSGFVGLIARAYYHVDREFLSRFARSVRTGRDFEGDIGGLLALRDALVKTKSMGGGRGQTLDYLRSQYVLSRLISGKAVTRILSPAVDLYPIPNQE